MLKFRKQAIMFVLVLIPFIGSSQNKNEQEMRIQPEDFPQRALQLLAHVPDNYKKIKYYKETDNSRVSYEAKLKINRRNYSIEFDIEGNLEDIEITLRKSELKKEVLKTVEDYLKNAYQKFYLLKIQKQYKKEPSIDEELLLEKAIKFSYLAKTNFEIIAQVQKDGTSSKVMEFTFDYEGSLLNERTIEPSSYEHVLY